MANYTIDVSEVKVVRRTNKIQGKRQDIVWGRIILCIVCGKEKFVSDYQWRKKESLAHQWCYNEVTRKRKKQDRVYTNGVILNTLVVQTRSSALTRGFVYELTREELEILVFADCIYCGQPPNKVYYDRYDMPYSGIDRVNNKLGYIASNCVTCCGICNKAKSTMTQDKFYEWINRLASHNGYIKVNESK